MARAASAPTTSSRHEHTETTISAIATSTHATHIQQRLLRVVVCAQKVKGHIRLVPHLALPSSFSGCRRWEYSERDSLCPLRTSPDTIEGDVRLRSRDTVNRRRRGTRRSHADRVPWWPPRSKATTCDGLPCCQMTYADLRNVGRNTTPRFRARPRA